jgi:hypothetical protein
MTTYELSHLTQPEDQQVIGPIQDDEALLLYAVIRVMRLKRILEVGGQSGYSAVNFCKAVGPNGVVYTAEPLPMAGMWHNHRPLQRLAHEVEPRDLDYKPLDLVFFDAHDYASQVALYTGLSHAGIITERTLIALHDTGLHPHKVVAWARETPRGWEHQTVERAMVDYLAGVGYDVINFHMDHSKASPELPYRHGLTILQYL